MKLYFDTKAKAWQLPGHQSRDADRVEVPDRAPELVRWLTDRGVGPLTRHQEMMAAPDDASGGFNTGSVAEWILDTATSAEVEQLFAAMGARFHELRKEAANGQN